MRQCCRFMPEGLLAKRPVYFSDALEPTDVSGKCVTLHLGTVHGTLGPCHGATVIPFRLTGETRCQNA